MRGPLDIRTRQPRRVRQQKQVTAWSAKPFGETEIGTEPQIHFMLSIHGPNEPICAPGFYNASRVHVLRLYLSTVGQLLRVLGVLDVEIVQNSKIRRASDLAALVPLPGPVAKRGDLLIA